MSRLYFTLFILSVIRLHPLGDPLLFPVLPSLRPADWGVGDREVLSPR